MVGASEPKGLVGKKIKVSGPVENGTGEDREGGGGAEGEVRKKQLNDDRIFHPVCWMCKKTLLRWGLFMVSMQMGKQSLSCTGTGKPQTAGGLLRKSLGRKIASTTLFPDFPQLPGILYRTVHFDSFGVNFYNRTVVSRFSLGTTK
jgi:hypothetical protein